MSRRSWLGRTIDDEGFVAVAPDAYSPKMQRNLLAYALTIDRDERIAAGKLGIAPRFQLVSLEQLLAVDAVWSIQGYHPRAFEAVHIWQDVNECGRSFAPPQVDTSQFDKKIPKPKWLHVGDWDNDPGFNPMYNGARHLMADFTGATETGGCVQNMELGDGRVVMAVEISDMFEIDSEGASLFMQFEVGDAKIHEKAKDWGSGYAFRHYQMLGTVSTSKRHIGTIDDMLRRAAWKDRHVAFDMSVDELLHRSVTDVQRKEGLTVPPGQTSLADELAQRLDAEHEAREKGVFVRMGSSG